MTDNITAYNLRLAKEKRKCNRQLVQYGEDGTMSKKDIAKWAIIRLRGKTPVNPVTLKIARNMVKNAIRASGEKLSHVKSTDITIAAKELIRQGAV